MKITSYLSITDAFAETGGTWGAEGKNGSLLMTFVIAQLPSNFERFLAVESLQVLADYEAQGLSPASLCE